MSPYTAASNLSAARALTVKRGKAGRASMKPGGHPHRNDAGDDTPDKIVNARPPGTPAFGRDPYRVCGVIGGTCPRAPLGSVPTLSRATLDCESTSMGPSGQDPASYRAERVASKSATMFSAISHSLRDDDWDSLIITARAASPLIP